ncbi:hypothetical protein AcW1_000923 [Taiwanofungus camphoratus]|nr:hypothetical protein AcW2_000576 [Antrodia cinnamomea]KAI0936777.1 hypothetical protein AcV5_004828 [Antrodia cinnamomea]KAI0964001.1 hypothetical protein AcW1_000923 [Antrodia cinnamomea]
MPVAIDGSRVKAASIPPLKVAMHKPQTPHFSDPPKVSEQARRLRKRKGKEVEEAESSANTSSLTIDGSWSWKSLTDSSASRTPPVFTKDGNYFFSVIGSSVKIYSVASGQIVSTLDASGSSGPYSAGSSSHLDTVTSAILNPHNPFQLITGSLDGLIRIWDFLDALLLQTINISQPIFHLAAHEKFKDCVFVAAARTDRKKTSNGKAIMEDNVAVLRVSLKATNATAGSAVQTSSDVTAVGKTKTTTGLAFSLSGAWLVAAGGHKAYVCSTSDLKAGFTKFVSPQPLTCLAFHPSEEYFATGDVTGCIRLWYCLNDNISRKTVGVEKTAQTTTLHWHAHAVSSIAFTANGAYLLSGGEEAVLVIWQLHTGKKEYVPRVGAPIVHVTLAKAGDGGEEYLLSLADASFVFVHSGTLKIARSTSRIKLDPGISHERPSTSTTVPLAIHSLTSTFILPSSHPSSLQMYTISTSKLLAEIEISPSNKVSRRDEKPLEPSRVQRVVISDSGEWMATVDSREPDGSFRGEVYLKLWRWDYKAAIWILNTRVDRPHALTRVTGIAFSPGGMSKGLILVTTGEDGNVKSWRIQSTKNKSGEAESFWVTRSTFRFRSEIPTHISWSSDGSLFAIVLGPYVALYDPRTNALYHTLVYPECKQLSSAHFVGQDSRYLAAVGPRHVVLWDLVTRTMRWHYRSSSVVEKCVPHPRHDTFLVFEQHIVPGSEPTSTKVLIFRPSSAVPTAIQTLPFHLRSVAWLPGSTPVSADSSFSLVGITQAWSVVVFGNDIHLPLEEGASAQGIVESTSDGKRTLFQDIFGKSALTDFVSAPPSVAENIVHPWKGKEIADIFNAPAYLMPPLETLFDSVLDGFLTARPHVAVEEHKHQEQDDTEQMDVEVDNELATAATRIERVVDHSEMQEFVELFKHHGITPPSLNQPTHTQINGTHEPNGVHKQQKNGTTFRSDHVQNLVLANGITQRPSQSSPGETVVTGKKRKMSSS